MLSFKSLQKTVGTLKIEWVREFIKCKPDGRPWPKEIPESPEFDLAIAALKRNRNIDEMMLFKRMLKKMVREQVKPCRARREIDEMEKALKKIKPKYKGGCGPLDKSRITTF